MRIALFLAVAATLSGCGSHTRVIAPPIVVPVYPGASAAKASVNDTFATTDWALPAGTSSVAVYNWYVTRLQKDGWKITGKNETGLHAVRGKATVDIGVRGRTLEAITAVR